MGFEEAGLSVALMLESDGPGGAEEMVLELAEGLRARGHRVCPVGPAAGCGWLAERFRERRFRPETFRLRCALDPTCVVDLVHILKRRRIDIVHSHEFTMTVYGALAARLTGRRHIATLHGGERWSERWRRRTALRWALRNGFAAVAVSYATRRTMERELDLPSDRIRVVPNGITPRSGNADRIYAELELPRSAILLLSVGSLYSVKGHDVLLRALETIQHVNAEHPWHLLIAGQGAESERLKCLSRQLGIENQISLLGYRNDVPDLLAAADMFVMPSRSEGLPLALLEAMFAGLAIVASDVGGIPEAITGDGDGILVPPDDPDALARTLDRMIRDPGLRAQLGRAAKHRAETRYTCDEMVTSYERLYRQSFGSRR